MNGLELNLVVCIHSITHQYSKLEWLLDEKTLKWNNYELEGLEEDKKWTTTLITTFKFYITKPKYNAKGNKNKHQCNVQRKMTDKK
jgi:hypothetical protein